MKSILFLTIFSIVIASSTQFAFAQTDEADAGITPDHPLYGLDVALDNLLLSITSDPEAKRILGLTIASERLAEVKIMIEQNKVDRAEIAKGHHDRVIKEVEDNLDNETGDSESRLAINIETSTRLQAHKDRVAELESTIRDKIQQDQAIFATQELTVLNRLADTIDDGINRAIIEVDSERFDVEQKFRDDEYKGNSFDTDRKIIELEKRLTDKVMSEVENDY